MQFLKIDRNYFWLFVLGFVLSTIIGVQTHELGHIAVAESLGYETKLSYGSMSHYTEGFAADADVLAWRKIFKENVNLNTLDAEEKAEMLALYEKIKNKYPNNAQHNFYITLGGPAQTILISFIGLFILAYRNNIRQEDFKIIDWIAVFLSLFILREVYNTVMAFADYLIQGITNFGGDEFRISTYLGFNQWVIPIMTAILGGIIASFIIFMIVPKKQRSTFIMAGFVGSTIGFTSWFYLLGPLLFGT
jgi:hypothetical protein